MTRRAGAAVETRSARGPAGMSIDRRCPTCLARPGVPCVTVIGKAMAGTHIARIAPPKRAAPRQLSFRFGR